MIRANVSFAHVGEPSSLRAWMCTIAAPASYARFASSAISTGVYGIAGQCFLVVTAPVRAQEMITLSAADTGEPLPPGRAESSAEGERRNLREVFDHPRARVVGD